MSQIAIFTSEHRGICIDRDKITFSETYSGCVFDAIETFAKKVPPATVCATYIQREQNCDFLTLMRIRIFLNAAGYKNISTFSTNGFITSTALNLTNPKCNIRDTVSVIHSGKHVTGVIVEKTAKGYEFLTLGEDIESFPEVQHMVIQMNEGDDKEEFIKKYEDLYSGETTKPHSHFIKVHAYCYSKDDDYLCKFVWNKYHGGNLNGNLVTDVAGAKVWFTYLDHRILLGLQTTPLPYYKEFYIDVWMTDKLRVSASYNTVTDNELTVKNYEYDDSERTTLKITVSIDLDHLLDVNVETKFSEVPQKIIPPRPEGKQNNVAVVTAGNKETKVTTFSVCRTGLYGTKSFRNSEAMVKSLFKLHPPSKVEVVFDKCESLAGIPRLRQNWSLLQKAGYTNIKPFDDDVFKCSIILHRLQLDVDGGQTIAIWDRVSYTILVRNGRKFQRILVALSEHKDPPAHLFEVYKVRTVVVDASYQKECDITNAGNYCLIVADFSHADETNYASCLWSIVDGTDFNGYLVEVSQSVVFKVCWNDKSEEFATGLVPTPYEWTVELDVEKASTLQVFAALVVSRLETIEYSEVKSFNMAKLGNDKISLTLCIDNVYQITTKCAALPPGRSPRPISLCLLIKRTAKGFRKTVYIRDSGKTIVTDCPSIVVAFSTFNQTEYAAAILNANGFTAEERKQLGQTATKFLFKDIQFVNDPIMKLNAILFGVDRDNLIHGSTVLVSDMTAVDKNGQKATMTYVLQCRQKKLKLQKILQKKVENVYKTINSVSHVFVAVFDPTNPPKLSQNLNSVFLQHSELNISNYLFARIDKDIDPIVDDITGSTFIADWTSEKQVIDVSFESVPFSRNVALHVGEAKQLKIDTTCFNSQKRQFLSEFTCKTCLDRVVLLNIAVDSLLRPSVEVIRSDLFPSTVLEFTADNRVVVNSDAVERLEYPAYISFGDSVLVGETALLRFYENPVTVVYDVYRFFDPDFDPTHPDPSWSFKTSLGTSDETAIYIGESETTSTVAFGTIVNAVKLDVENKGNCKLSHIGIRMPHGIIVSQKVCSVIETLLNIKLVVLP